MRLSLPDKTLPDNLVWGFRSDFDDEAYLKSKNSPRWSERFGDADHPIPDGRRLDEIVRDLCRESNVCQPLIWAKFIGETSFLTAAKPPGKGYKAPLGFDCPDGGRDPRPEFYGVVPNIRGAVKWWGTFKDKWEWQRRLRDGVEEVNVMSEGDAAQWETVKVRTAAEVAYLKYTPHLYSLHDFMAILAREFPGSPEGREQTMGKYVPPIDNMTSLGLNTTLHGRSVYRPVDIPGHNVFKGYSEWANNGNIGVGDAIDLGADAATPVYALADGIQTLWQGDMTRKEVIFLEGDGWLAVYAHINAVHEGTGMAVKRGEVVGKLRGDLDCPHVHFELWLGGKSVSARTPGQTRDLMRAKLGLTDAAPTPGDPRLIVAKPDAGAIDGLAYLELPSRWDHAARAILADTQALKQWLGRNGAPLPEWEHIREAMQALQVEADYNLAHLSDPADPRIYVTAKL